MSVLRDAAERDRAIARGVLLASLAGSLLLAIWLALQDARALPIAAALALALIGAWPLAASLGRRAANPGWLLALAALNAVIVVPELALRLSGFRYEAGTQFGYPRPSQFAAFEPHRQLFWSYRPSDPDINSWGFRGPEVELPKPSDVFRVLTLGDSCSEKGYPEELERQLGSERTGSTRFAVTRLATSGYSSHQGRLAAELYAERIEPDLALVYFGWNDHWRAYGAPDAEKQVVLSDGLLDRAYARSLRVSRLVGLAGWLRDGLRGVEREPSDSPRVPPEDYRENLHAIARQLRGAGAEVIFVTAPTSFYSLGVPVYLMQAGLTPDAETLLAEHRGYNQIVREVARDESAYLLDLEAELGRLPNDELESIFRLDGIHFTPLGAERVAAQVAAFLALEGLLPGQTRVSRP
jgi:lysophospholipase L1-like esterase